MKVLVVDDSVTFRSAIKAALASEAGIEVSGVAANGKIALAKLENDSFDLMILDLEMPDMDGLETLQAMRQRNINIKTLIFASPTAENYQKVSLALRLGAADFLAKPSNTAAMGSVETAIESIRSEIIPRLRSLGVQPTREITSRPAETSTTNLGSKPAEVLNTDQTLSKTWNKRDIASFHPKAIVIASSTGGPMALEKLFANITAPLRIPIFIVQHMPPPFTKGLASRIEEITRVPCSEGVDGESIQTNHIYIAPADFHMALRTSEDGVTRIVITQGTKINFVRPAADPLFTSAAGIYRGSLMGFVLTGMGEDGKAGACDLKRAGGGLMIQDQATSVVWGMPGAVFNVNAQDAMGTIDECAMVLRRMVTL